MSYLITISKINDEAPSGRGMVQQRRHGALSDRNNSTSGIDTDHNPPVYMLKRKREGEENRNDGRLCEFLNVMQGPSKSKTWADQDTERNNDLSPQQNPPQEIITGSSNEEGAHVLSTSTEKSCGAHTEQPEEPMDGARSSQNYPSEEAGFQHSTRTFSGHDPVDIHMTEGQLQPTSAVSDSDWLRSRTSRLLGLVDDEEDTHPNQTAKDFSNEVEDGRLQRRQGTYIEIQGNGDSVGKKAIREDTAPEECTNDASVENGRLFVRNLAYTVNTDDVRQCFTGHGELTEVGISFSHFLYLNLLMHMFLS